EKVFAKCLEIISSKLLEIKEAQAAISESANNESKSTAGDKHETGRAMLQLEQEKLGNQLKELEAREDDLKKINITEGNKICGKGSLILTDKGYLFLSIGLGKIKIDSITVYALSMQSPLGAKLSGAIVNDKIEMNGVVYQIKELL
ncbi:MAG: 3-oxoacyl-ACP synthase, partial [Bacteroidia bacterium]